MEVTHNPRRLSLSQSGEELGNEAFPHRGMSHSPMSSQCTEQEIGLLSIATNEPWSQRPVTF